MLPIQNILLTTNLLLILGLGGWVIHDNINQNKTDQLITPLMEVSETIKEQVWDEIDETNEPQKVTTANTAVSLDAINSLQTQVLLLAQQAQQSPAIVEGRDGDQGVKGEKGDRGDKGEAGEKGDRGEQGQQGPEGPIGPTGFRGTPGDTGATGPQGQQGISGAQGANGVSGWQRITTNGSVSSNSDKTVDASCPSSKNVLGGGCLVSGFGGNKDIQLLQSYPISYNNTWHWRCSAKNIDPVNTGNLYAYAICAEIN
jgi:hypothetical protein